MKKNNDEINKALDSFDCGYREKKVEDKKIADALDRIAEKCNNFEANKMTYRCAICGKAYDTIDERVACETKCLADRKKAQAEFEKKKKLEEKNARKTEIEKKYKELVTLVNNYCKDYGSLQIGETRYFADDDYPTISKLLGWWL